MNLLNRNYILNELHIDKTERRTKNVSGLVNRTYYKHLLRKLLLSLERNIVDRNARRVRLLRKDFPWPLVLRQETLKSPTSRLFITFTIWSSTGFLRLTSYYREVAHFEIRVTAEYYIDSGSRLLRHIQLFLGSGSHAKKCHLRGPASS